MLFIANAEVRGVLLKDRADIEILSIIFLRIIAYKLDFNEDEEGVYIVEFRYLMIYTGFKDILGK